MSFIIFIMVAILAFIILKVGDTRDWEKEQIRDPEKIDPYIYFPDHRIIYLCISVVLDDLRSNQYIHRCIPVSYTHLLAFCNQIDEELRNGTVILSNLSDEGMDIDVEVYNCLLYTSRCV